MSDCKPDGQHMTLDTFSQVIDFYKRYNPVNQIMITGGEIFEHPQIKNFIDLAVEAFTQVTLITNGDILSSNDDFYSYVAKVKRHLKRDTLMIQVTNDPKYYPKILTQKQIYRLKKLGAFIDTVPVINGQSLYPQGRALINHKDTDWCTIAPKCANLRMLVKQGFKDFRIILTLLLNKGKACTPSIAPDGSIKLGESALCPNCAHINDDNYTIISKIRDFNCQQCSIPLERLKNLNYNAYKILIS